MAEGKYCIMRLNASEYKAALAAIKLVRGNDIKNAFTEGWLDGFRAYQDRYNGARMDGELASWERSHAKALSETSDGETK